MTNYLTTKQVAAKLGISPQRVRAKIKAAHFPGSIRCPCGQQGGWLIPEPLEGEINWQHENRKIYWNEETKTWQLIEKEN